MGKQSDRYADLTRAKVAAVFNKLGGMEGADRFLRGEMELVVKKHLIDCDAPPSVPDGWEVVEHKPGGKLEFDPAKIELYLCAEQKQGSIEGHELRKKLEGKPVLNACVLDYLLKHQELISEEWKDKYIFFWGTIYRSPGGDLCVRCLVWYGDEWHWGDGWLGSQWSGVDPAVLCK